MLEIPESHTIAKQLNQTVAGKQIASVEANASPHGFAFYSGDPEGYPALLEGRTVEYAEALAGQVEITLGDARLLFGDGANIRYYAAGEKLPAKHQLCVRFTDGSALVCTIQMYGGIWAFLEGENDNFYYTVAKEKPNPLTGAFDRVYFDSLWDEIKPTLSVKGLLATEQRIPGLGNGTLQDILYRAGLHPKSRAEALDREQRDRLFQSVKHTLREMTEQGGRDTEKDLFGNPGGYRSFLSKNTVQYPCLQCGGPLVRQAYLGGNVYFCPICQPMIR